MITDCVLIGEKIILRQIELTDCTPMYNDPEVEIECRWQGIRDYCKYIKRSYGRTNHLVCIDIRNNEMRQESGLKLDEEYDRKRPVLLDGFLNISEEEFENILLDNEVFD